MRSAARVVATLATAGLLATGVGAISNVTRSGRYLYNADGTRFFIKGIAYQTQGMFKWLWPNVAADGSPTQATSQLTRTTLSLNPLHLSTLSPTVLGVQEIFLSSNNLE
ncbi:hypothetical protein PHLCEN_2v6641 [Hermanssonia centrifuga]|uniref:Uncharacterized protein n=1 Tax=Hermanssonia centrifuga TaxID=98765 RepID=A0A2R6NYT6_9APHY|nr:hypothetical protein PHLCEN_2v6641 [Hermanssonia centrifuga]